jgi:hypothetical protein
MADIDYLGASLNGARRPLETKGSRKNNFTFYTPIHLFQLRCESSEYPDIPAFSRPRLSGMTHLF